MTEDEEENKPEPKKEHKVELDISEPILLRWETITAIILLFALAFLFKENFWLLFLLTGAVILSRGSPLYPQLRFEIHAMIILGVGNVFGVWPAAFMAIASTPFINKIGKILGSSFQKPIWVLLDTSYLVVLSVIAGFIPEAGLKLYGLVAVIIIGNGIVGAIKTLVFGRTVVKQVILAMLNTAFNYIILWNLLPAFLAFLK